MMFCDFLPAFRVLELIKSEASLKQTSYPECKISIFIFAWNIPPNTFAHYYLQWASMPGRGQVIFLVFHRPTAVEKYGVYVKPRESFMHQQGKTVVPVLLNTSSPLPISTLHYEMLTENAPCPRKADQLCYKSRNAVT